MRVREFLQGQNRKETQKDDKPLLRKSTFRFPRWAWSQEKKNTPSLWRARRGWGWWMSREFFKWSFQFPWNTPQPSGRDGGAPPVVKEKPRDLFDKCRRFTRAAEVRKSGFYPYFSPIQSSQEPNIELNGRSMLMLGSNSYLGLTTHPKVKEAAQRAIQSYGSSCSGSRFLNGTLEIHVELEERLARFVGKAQSIVFTTGFQANLGAISTLVGKDDRVITDKVDHASIIDGARLSSGRMLRFNHNRMSDLERILRSCNNSGGKLIVVDGVFSMDGDVADLPGIMEVAKRHGAHVMVDDAHGLGVMGPQGRGTTAHFGLTEDTALIMGTFSKSFASIGGFVAGESQIIDFIRHHARSLIFSASLPPAQVASTLAALEILEEEPERLEQLWDNTRYLRAGLQSLGFDTGRSETPIIPVIIGDDTLCFQTWLALQEEGIFVNPIISPAVLSHQALIRVSVMASHERHHLDRALQVFSAVGKKLGLI